MSTTLRPATQRRLRLLRRRPRWGSDVTGSLRLLVDAGGHVLDVRIDTVPGGLRQTACLEAAVRSALADAGAPAEDDLPGLRVEPDWLRTASAGDLREALLEALGAPAGG